MSNSTFLNYKGYVGSIRFSKEDKCLYGEVLGMTNHMVTYEGSNLSELKKDFEGAVDDYLVMSASTNIVEK